MYAPYPFLTGTLPMPQDRTWFKQHTAAENLTKAVVNLIYHLGVPVTPSTVSDVLQAHPHFPSVAAAVHALQTWGIDAQGSKITSDLLDRIPLPCLADLHNGTMVVLIAVADGQVTFIDPAHGWITSPVETFDKQWNGTILAVETTDEAGEKDYAAQRQKERRAAWRRHALWAGSGVAALLALGLMVRALWGTPVLLGLPIAKSLGLAVSLALVLHHVSHTNPLLQRVCPAGPTVNCAGVLRSRAALLFGWLPMADLGALYFAGGLLTLLLAGLHEPALPGALFFLAVLTVLALPYTVFSVYYQARVVKQWCWLCLAVQALFWVEFLLIGPYTLETALALDPMAAAVTVLGFGLPALVWLAVQPALKKAGETDAWYYRYLRLRRNPAVVEQLLQQETPVSITALPIELKFGRDEAPYVLTVVAHPQCPACARAYREARHLLDAYPDQIAVVLRFYCPEPDGPGKELARNTLALIMQKRQSEAVILLERWHTHPLEPSYWMDGFTRSENLYDAVDSILRAIVTWARAVPITGTPTVYLNARPLPPGMDVADLLFTLQDSRRA